MTATVATIRSAKTLALVALGVLTLSACGDSHRLTSEEAWIETSAAKAHPIDFVGRREYLDVELPPSRHGLSRNQYADVYRFALRYKQESTGRLAVSHGGARYGGAAVADVRRAIEEAGIDPSRVARGKSGGRHLLTLSYERPVALAPECGHWPRDVGRERERVPYTDFGCATQRNLAGMVQNSRDLIGSQDESPASSERRGRVWSSYTGGDASSVKQVVGDTASESKPKSTKK
ncbi:MAG: CpaD family pilus assembly lipoprotein [Hyphomicrobiaceae bacterium]